MSQKAIVFGGSGFLGSYVVEELTRKGYKVTVFDRRSSSYINSDQKMIVGDILDAEQVRGALKGQDIVFHFAGLSDLDLGADQPLPF